eukprot:TRINITY_DN5447_c0_g1_i1.p1 TRINITY_DN5447_c0_g1~~TRINITY_DN5447_c0_g1_i1.p1  ORF type:complete len:509 (+),score=127.75 TRINITY_DN5447_c0_g1_i1:211-1527(+)
MKMGFVLLWSSKYPIFKMHIFRRCGVVVTEPELIKEAMNNPAFNRKEPVSYKVFGRFIGKTSTLVTYGKEWSSIHKLVQPIFHKKNMEDIFFSTMLDCINSYSQVLSSHVYGSPNAKEGIFPLSSIDIDHMNTLFTLDIITRCMFGVKFESGAEGISRAVNEGAAEVQRQVGSFIYALTPLARWRAEKATQDVRRDFREILTQKRNRQNDQKERRKDLADLLLEARDPETKQGLDEESIIDQCVTFMLAGHDTTAHTLSWVFYLLAQRPDVEAKLLEEIKGGMGDSDHISYEKLGQLKYMNAIIKETMRVYPSVFITGRIVSEDTTLGGFTIPKGTRVIFNIQGAQYSEKYYPNPSVWDPERWMTSDENFPGHTHAWIPFSKGERMCVGFRFAMMEIRLAIAQLVPKFRFEIDRTKSVLIQRNITTQGIQHLIPKFRE